MEIIVYVTRCVVMFLVTFTGLRIIGKKSIAQLTTYELAGILLITTVAAEPLTYKIPTKSTVGVITLAICVLTLSIISLNKKFYNLDSHPSILINKGIIDYKALKYCRLNITYLLSLLRLKGYANVSDIEYAILELNGDISIVPKSDLRPVRPSDLKIATKYEGLPLIIIIDGQLQEDNLKIANVTKEWLSDELKQISVNDVKDVVYAEIDNNGKLYASTYTQCMKQQQGPHI